MAVSRKDFLKLFGLGVASAGLLGKEARLPRNWKAPRLRREDEDRRH